jgi:hypothetical protein
VQGCVRRGAYDADAPQAAHVFMHLLARIEIYPCRPIHMQMRMHKRRHIETRMQEHAPARTSVKMRTMHSRART